MRVDRTDYLTVFVAESNAIEGIERDPTVQEIQAHIDFLDGPGNILSLLSLVGVVQPGARLRDRYGLNVRVGQHVAPPGGASIREDLQRILEDTRLDPYERHLAYEDLHPFTDGNGRSGRALWLKDMQEDAPLGFLHTFYYQALAHADARA